MEKDYNFKKFIGVGSRTGNYFISFNKSGFMISSGFYLRERIKDFSRVVLYFDSSRSAVAIQFINDDKAEGSFALTHGNKETTGSISARSFVVAHDLNNSRYFGRKIPKKINYQGNEIFVIDLITEGKGNENTNTAV